MRTELSDQAKELFESMDTRDEWKFQYRPYFYWLPESTEDRVERLTLNACIYRLHAYFKNKLPEKIHKARMDDFKELQALGKTPSRIFDWLLP